MPRRPNNIDAASPIPARSAAMLMVFAGLICDEIVETGHRATMADAFAARAADAALCAYPA